MKKALKVLAGVSILVLIALGGLWLALPSFNDYRVDGELKVAGLEQPVEVKRDEKGMAYAYAQSLDDALFAQGFLTAQDRFFNMHLVRLMIQGRLTELVGEGGLEIDIRHRTLGLSRLARAHGEVLSPSTRRTYERYAAGVNAFLQATPEDLHLEFRLAGLEPEPWTVEDSLAVLYLMSWNNAANLKHELTYAGLVAAVGEERAATLMPVNVNPDDPAGPETPKNLEILDGAAEPVEEKTGETSGTVAWDSGLGELLDDPLLSGLAGGQSLRSDLHGGFEVGGFEVGSNNWAAAADRTAGGGAMLAGDPHLDPRMLPGVWYPLALIWPGNRAVGANIPGMPGMGLGRTDFVALSMTNAYGDNQDLFLETLGEGGACYMDGESCVPFEVRREVLRIKDGDGFREHVHEIRSTRRGPVVSGVLPGLDEDRVVSLRWAVTDPSMRTPDSPFVELLNARSVTDVDAALEHLPTTALNFVFADVHGGIGWRASGRLPIRKPGTGSRLQPASDEDPWIGWIPFDQMPHVLNPADGWVGTANHRTVTRDFPFYYSNYFASSYRYARLKQLFAEAQDPLTVDDFWAWQRDVFNPMAAAVAPVLARALETDETTRTLGEILAGWDHQDRPDGAAPLIFQEVYRRLALLMFSDEMGRDTAEAMLDNLYFWQERLQRLVVDGGADAESWIDDVGTESRETLDELIVTAGRQAAESLAESQGADPHGWHWGSRHYLKLVHALRRDGRGSDLLGTGPLPMGGSPETLYRGGYKFNAPYATSFAASLRWVVDFADPEKVQGVLPGGIAGRIFHPHYKDQVPAFMSGEPLWWWFSDDAIEAHAEHRLRLLP